MLRSLLFCVVLTTVCVRLNGAKSAVPTPDGTGYLTYSEEWGYVTVRQDAHTFWWLYKSDDTPNRPLIVWFQGGPGASGTGFGNFQEIGPVDDLNQNRSTTWLHKGDVIFIDCPVGSGFSYVDNLGALTKDIDAIGDDLIEWAKQWFGSHPEYQTRDFYIFCESYGGKYAAAFGAKLYKAIQAGEVKANLKAVALGDAWISPIDYTNTFGPYLHATNYLDQEGLDKMQVHAKRCENLLNNGDGGGATDCWSGVENLVEMETNGVSFYNILKYNAQDPWSKLIRNQSNLVADIGISEKSYARHVLPTVKSRDLTEFMNGVIREKLNIIPPQVRWGAQSGSVFEVQAEDFMKPVLDKVEFLLKETNVKVIVYNGQLDLICDTLGTETWVRKLQWDGLEAWKTSQRNVFRVGLTSEEKRQIAGYYKNHENFYFFWVMRAGHMVPHDAPFAMYYILDIALH